MDPVESVITAVVTEVDGNSLEELCVPVEPVAVESVVTVVAAEVDDESLEKLSVSVEIVPVVPV